MPCRARICLQIPGNLLAHHFGVLEQAGIITRRPSQHDRRRTYVQLVDGAFDGLLPQPGLLTAPRVVFVCTHNSARSVLAEALWRDVSEVPSTSAGTSPAAQINPRALKAAERFGLTVKRQAPQRSTRSWATWQMSASTGPSPTLRASAPMRPSPRSCTTCVTEQATSLLESGIGVTPERDMHDKHRVSREHP